MLVLLCDTPRYSQSSSTRKTVIKIRFLFFLAQKKITPGTNGFGSKGCCLNFLRRIFPLSRYIEHLVGGRYADRSMFISFSEVILPQQSEITVYVQI